MSTNIRTFNDTLKQQTLYTYIEKKEIDIIYLQDTSLKISDSQTTFSHTHTTSISPNKLLNLPNNYLSWSTANNLKTYGHRVTIIVKKPIVDHVYKIQQFEGYGIAIIFAFKGNYHLVIINIYNSSFTNKLSPISPKLEKWTKKIINESKIKNQQVIFMGDLNQTYRTKDR